MRRTAVERGIISAVLRDRKIEPVIEARITDEFFSDDEHREVWLFVKEHWTKYSEVPEHRTLRSNFPSWKVVESAEPLAFYIDEMREHRRMDIAQDGYLRATEALQNDDVAEAIAVMGQAALDANTQLPTLANVPLLDSVEERVKRYDEYAKNKGALRGWPTGFDAINRATRGVQPEQYIVILGAQKAGKSTILMYMGIVMSERGARVLMVSFEMSAEEMGARHDSLRAEISYNRLMDGRMTKDDRAALLATQDADGDDVVLCTDISATTTVSGIRAQIQKERPDVVLIDGAYLMQDERGEAAGSPQAMTNISRDLKRLAQSTKIPIIISTQALESKMTKRSGITAFSAGYSSAWGQDCDVMLGIQRSEDDPKMSELRVLLSRSGPLATANIYIDWEAGRVEEHDEPNAGDVHSDEDEDEPREKAYF